LKLKNCKHYLFFFLPLIAIFGPYAAVQGDESEYLDAVEADVEEFTTGTFSSPANSTWVGTAQDHTTDVHVNEDKLDDFSNFLREKSPGSYIFYSKLPHEYQNRLHQEYLASGDMEKIKRNIFIYMQEIKEKDKP
jgi:hypothetical protein